MKLIYQTANPRKKVAKKATRKTKRKNPTEVTYTKEGGGRQTATLYSGQERAQMIKGKYALTQAQKKVLARKVGGTGRAANLVNKKKQTLSKSLDSKIAKFTTELKNATGARKKELMLKLQGFKPERDKEGNVILRNKPLHGELTEATAKRIASSIEKASRAISDKGVKALADKIKKGKKVSRTNKASARASARSSEMKKLREELASLKKGERERVDLLPLGASDRDKAELIDIRREMKDIKKRLSNSKGVGMAKKAKKVATKKRKKAKTVKVAKKAKKKVASKKTATKKRAKRTKRSKAKGIVALATAPKRRKTRRKASKKVAVKATVKRKTSKKRGAKKASKKTKRNPYVMSNPYIKSNPMFTKIDSILDRALGVSVVELGGVILAAGLSGKMTELAKRIPVLGEQVAKIPAAYQVTAIEGLVGALAVAAEHFMAKKKMKSSAIVGDIGRGFLLNALIGGIKTLSPLAVNAPTPMAGYVTDSTPRGMSGYVLDNGMAGSLALADSDFKGMGSDFDGSTIGGADFDGSTIGSMNDSVSDNFDFDSNPNW